MMPWVVVENIGVIGIAKGEEVTVAAGITAPFRGVHSMPMSETF